jgi:hypothetical protein
MKKEMLFLFKSLIEIFHAFSYVYVGIRVIYSAYVCVCFSFSTSLLAS